MVNTCLEKQRLAQLAWLLVALNLLFGCRFGGGTGPEISELSDSEQAAQESDESESGGDDDDPDNVSNSGGSDYGGSGVGGLDDGDSDARGRDFAGSDTGYSDWDDSSSESPGDSSYDDQAVGGAECINRPVVTGCDPTVEGTCPDLMQCVIDLLAPTAAGVCVFSTPMGEEMCFSSPMTESCPPTFTCFWGVCEEMCLCDEDCSTGRCCGEPVGDQGFKLCADC